MANPILKEDLIANDVQPALDKMLETLGKIDGALTSMRGSLSQHAKGIMDDVNAHQSDAEAMGKYAAKITELEKAISDLTKAQKENANMQSQVHTAKSRSIELSEYEKRHLEEIEKRLKLGAVWQERTAQAIDTTNMSYNAMKATLNTLLSTLRSFETESKKNSTEAMALESAVERLRDAMKELDNNTKAVANAEKQMAEESKKAAKEAAEAAKQEAEEAKKAAKEKADAEKKAAKEKSDADKEAAAAAKAAAKERAQFGKLNDNEYESVRRLNDQYQGWVRTLEAGHSIHLVNYNDIEVEKMSYNQLYSTYNVLKDALNKLTTEQRENSEVGKYMTAQALKARDTMNELQKSTGNYTLQVGKYRAAFDGLGYSMQQILREAPSALNLNQFFLAISNNIPMFIDQLKAFKDEQADIAENLKKMTEGTEEYIKEQEKQMSVWKKLGGAIFSWQTAVLGVLLLLRKLPDIVEKIKEKFKGLADRIAEIREKTREMQLQAERDTTLGVEESVSKVRLEIDLIIEKLSEVQQGSKAWEDGVKSINKLIGENIDLHNDDIKKIREVANEYIEMYRKIEKNRAIIKILTEDDINRLKRDHIEVYNVGVDANVAASTLGLNGEEKEKFIKEYEGIQEDLIRARGYLDDYYRRWNKMTDKEKEYYPHPQHTDVNFKYYDLQKKLQALIDSYALVLDDDVRDMYENAYELVEPLNDNDKGPKGRTYTEKDVLDRTWEVMEARARMIQDEQRREEELQKAANQKAIQENDKTWETQKEHLAFNLEHKFITLDEYNVKMDQAERDHDLIRQGLEEENQQKLMEIWHKYDEKRQEAIRRSEKDQIDAILKYGELRQKAVRKRVKSISDEKEKNAELLHNVRELEATIERLNAQSLTDPESIDKRAEEVGKLTKQIEKLKNELGFDKQLTNYSSIWDILQRNGAFEASKATKKEMLRGLLGNIVDELDDEQIASNFEKYLDTMKDSAKTWYTTTRDYINELIDAYIELANAKADAAREATEAAQEEYEKEKALLEAGYANRVETMWAEYQQKKALQEQAEADAKAAAAAQKRLNEIETAGSLVTASANIWRAFGQWPPLAIAAIATMWGSFLAAKSKAFEVAQYGDGDVQLVGGGSHLSGHDTLLGYSLQGREMRVENGEVVGIIPRRSVKRLGEQNVLNTMRALRDGTFEANAVKMMDINRNAGNIMVAAQGKVDLSKVERSLNNIDRRGETQTYVDAQGNIIEKKSNGTTKYIKR